MMILIRVAICAAVTYAASRFSAAAAVVTVALWGALMAKPIIELGANWFNWARREPYEKWQGNYYEYANVQIRIIELGKRRLIEFLRDQYWKRKSVIMQLCLDASFLVNSATYSSSFRFALHVLRYFCPAARTTGTTFPAPCTNYSTQTAHGAAHRSWQSPYSGSSCAGRYS
jgi:hypothetical protein